MQQGPQDKQEQPEDEPEQLQGAHSTTHISTSERYCNSYTLHRLTTQQSHNTRSADEAEEAEDETRASQDEEAEGPEDLSSYVQRSSTSQEQWKAKDEPDDRERKPQVIQETQEEVVEEVQDE